ncbi:unnamed protein product [Adineta steineri]|uniref:Uncharacterized protein n=1 Tax=Adineta steineri TaxID=433720 RepID=A0A813U421_9BILA|nr:unnamed protein product [Adineta steineri]CAF1424791.1 unnamed protein product [Adineta steineri]CAF1425404.1 unnamed protein product [Adineta steineri]
MSRSDDDFLNQPITAMDHPILRAHASLDPNSAEAQSQLRRLVNQNYIIMNVVTSLSRDIRAAPNPYDTNAQLTTGIRNNKSSLR